MVSVNCKVCDAKRDVGFWQVCAASFILDGGLLRDDHTFLPDYETLQE